LVGVVYASEGAQEEGGAECVGWMGWDDIVLVCSGGRGGFDAAAAAPSV
jgi:hypothetical protein